MDRVGDDFSVAGASFLGGTVPHTLAPVLMLEF